MTITNGYQLHPSVDKHFLPKALCHSHILHRQTESPFPFSPVATNPASSRIHAHHAQHDLGCRDHPPEETAKGQARRIATPNRRYVYLTSTEYAQ